MNPKFVPWLLISQLYWMSYKLLERRLDRLGVTDSQARLLSVLHYANQPMKPSRIATVLFQEPQSVTGIISRLELRGWLRKSPDAEDRRAVGVELTDEGEAIAAEVVRAEDELYKELFASSLTTTQQRELVKALERVRSKAFALPDTDFRLRRALQFSIWRE